MAAEYKSDLVTNKDHVRALLGDVPPNGAEGTVTDPILQDETINAKLTSAGWAEGLAQLADMSISIIGKEPSKYSESLGIMVDFRDRIPSLRRISAGARGGQIPEPGELIVTVSNKTGTLVNKPTW